jgi:anti-sigma factor RsiW
MKRQTLESLLMDQSLEQLSPDVEELLEAYIAEHPQYLQTAESIRKSAALAKQALSSEAAKELPPFPKERIIHAKASGRWKLFCKWGLSAAACLLIGTLIGISLTQQQNMNMQQQLTNGSILADNMQTVPDVRGLETARAFWSAERYENLFMKNRAAPAEKRNQTDIYKAMEKFRKRGLL